MKKIVFWIFAVPILTIAGWLAVQLISISFAPYYVSDIDIHVESTVTQNANMYQNNAAVDMLPMGNKMYYYIESWPGSLGVRSRFDRSLCVIEYGKIKSVSKISKLYGYDQRYIYGQMNGMLISYDTQTGKEKKLVPLSENMSHTAVIDPDGTLRIMGDKETTSYFAIKNGQLRYTRQADTVFAEYDLGGKLYSVRAGRVFCGDKDISGLFGNASFRAMIPYGDGLLLINDGYGNLVYFIQPDGSVFSLFQEVPCMCTTSSINFYEEYIFVSFKRWESYGTSGFGMKSFENDTLEGTYRIDMANLSAKKINNNIYNGMFIFDDSGIYACNNDGDIHHLDFNGNILQTIVD